MKLLLQILFLLLTWFTNLVNATPLFTKDVLPNYGLPFSKTENAKEEFVVDKLNQIKEIEPLIKQYSHTDTIFNPVGANLPQSVFYNMEILTLFP